MFRWNFLCFTWWTLPFTPFSGHYWAESISVLLNFFHQVVFICIDKIPLSLPFFTLKSPSSLILSSCLNPTMCMWQGFTFPIEEVHEVTTGPLLQPLKVPLNSRDIWYTSHSSQFCIICKCTKVVLHPIFQVINKDVEIYWSQYWTLEYSTSDWPQAGLCAADRNFLNSAGFIQSNSLSIYLVCIQFVYEDATGNSVQCWNPCSR